MITEFEYKITKLPKPPSCMWEGCHKEATFRAMSSTKTLLLCAIHKAELMTTSKCKVEKEVRLPPLRMSTPGIPSNKEGDVIPVEKQVDLALEKEKEEARERARIARVEEKEREQKFFSLRLRYELGVLRNETSKESDSKSSDNVVTAYDGKGERELSKATLHLHRVIDKRPNTVEIRPIVGKGNGTVNKYVVVRTPDTDDTFGILERYLRDNYPKYYRLWQKKKRVQTKVFSPDGTLIAESNS